jgi:phosphate:Na+ symporter
MVVGFVNSGTMMLSQAMGVIMGANVGTAVTAWLTATKFIEGGSGAFAWTQYLKTDAWMPILALLGIALIMFSKKSKFKDIGAILMGFAVLMTGMDVMSAAVKPLSESEAFKSVLTAFSNPFLGILVGTVFTAIVQSSSASVGVLQTLAMSTGAISFSAAMPIVLGQNIGTCVTAMISSAGATKNGKRAAFMHLYYNIIGVALWMGVYYLVGWILETSGGFSLFGFMDGTTANALHIAILHTVFKIVAVALLFPFTKFIEKLAVTTVRGDDKKGDEFTDMLDERLLDTPSVAIERCRVVTCEMARLSVDSLNRSMTLFDQYDSKLAEEIQDIEGKVDIYEDALGSYLLKLSARAMPERDSREVTMLMHMIGDLERISDHAVNVVESAEELKDKSLSFSNAATVELKSMRGAIEEIVNLTESALVENDLDKAALVEPLEQVVDDLKDYIKRQHIIRVQKNQCSIEQGFILSDLLTNLERVSDHCSNIASCLVEMTLHDSMDLHNYLHKVKAGSEEFNTQYQSYSQKYAIKTIE